MNKPGNYYILLDLEHTCHDLVAIKKRITEKQATWSKAVMSGTGTQKTNAALFLECLNDINKVMQDDELRQSEAGEAEKVRGEEANEAPAALKKKIDLLIQQGQAITQDQMEELAKDFSKWFTRQQIIERIPVEFRAGEAPAVDDDDLGETLTGAVGREIKDNLSILNIQNLYEFLGVNRNAGAAAMVDRAREITKELAVEKESPTLKINRSLASRCATLFENEKGREKYENTLAKQVAEDVLKKDVNLLAKAGRITAAAFEKLLETAGEKGLKLELAKKYIRSICKKKNVQLLEDDSLAHLQQCVCGVPNSAKARNCKACGQDLRVVCPGQNCGVEVRAGDSYCTNCGFAIGNMQMVNQLVEQAEQRFAQNNLDVALLCLDQAGKYWPHHKRIPCLRKNIDEAVGQRDGQIQQINDLVKNRKFHRAKSTSDNLAQTLNPPDALETLTQQIDEALKTAIELCAKADVLRQAGHMDAAFVKYQSALKVCSDLPSAENGWKMCKPSPVAGEVVVHLLNANVHVQWQPSPSAKVRDVEYRVQRICIAPQSEAKTKVCSTASPSALSFIDENTIPGCTYMYRVTVFGAGENFSQPIDSKPFVVLGEVNGLIATGLDGAIRVQWDDAPRLAKEVRIRRQENNAPRRGKRFVEPQGELLKSSAGKSVTDDGLTNDMKYGYRVYCVFEDHEGGAIYSAGATATATPESPPPRLENLRAGLNDLGHDSRIRIKWDKPDGVQLVIKKKAQAPQETKDQVSAVADLGEIADRFCFRVKKSIQFKPVRGHPYYLIYARNRHQARFCGELHFVELESLKCVVEAHSARLSWEWPSHCNAVEIRLPSIPKLEWTVHRRPGEKNGHWEVPMREIPHGSQAFHLNCKLDELSAMRVAGSGRTIDVQVRNPFGLKWWIERDEDNRAFLVLSADRNLESLTCIQLRAKVNRRPEHRDDGNLLLHIDSLYKYGHTQKLLFRVNYQKPAKGKFRCQLFVEPEDAAFITVPDLERATLD